MEDRAASVEECIYTGKIPKVIDGRKKDQKKEEEMKYKIISSWRNLCFVSLSVWSPAQQTKT